MTTESNAEDLNSLIKTYSITINIQHLLFPKPGSHHHKNIYFKLLTLRVSKKLKIHKKLVHAGSSRHQDMKEKIQSKLEALAHPEDPV